jgi:uncharacterized protein (TIGR02217 family)
MSFHEIRFPEHISYGSSGGPKFKTTIFMSDGGYEQRNIDWSEAKAEYNVSHGIKTRAEMDELRAFFYARAGRAYGFRYKDWADYIAANQVIGIGNGTQTIFQMIKTYVSGSNSFGRPLKKLVAGTLTGVTVNGSPATHTVNNNTGLITLSSAPALDAVVAVNLVEFDVPVRFDTDHLDAEHDFWETQSWPNIPLVELRL